MFDNTPDTKRDLTLTRIIDAPREKLYRCWTEPELLKQWFAPLPYTTPVAEVDVRPGGSAYIVMRGPDGTEHPIRSVYLDIVPNRRVVSTNAFVEAWKPADTPVMPFMMTMSISFEDEGDGKTRYTALVRHWSTADRETHEKMGFHQGWSICTDQLAALAKTL